MNVKRYEAKNIQEALQKIKMDLGPDATILYVREVVRHQSFRLTLANAKHVEVIAGVDDREPARVNSTKLEMIQYELREVKNFIRDFMQQASQAPSISKGLVPAMRQFCEKLNDCEVDNDIIEQFVKNVQERVVGKDLNDMKLIEELFIKHIAQMFEVSGPIVSGNNKIVAFVGPTGVGKTTTIAKLAANYTLLEKKKVALITIDTYRIAAVEQLKTYAEIMGIPIEVVFSPKEIVPVLHKHKEKDLIFIDTAGRNPLNDSQMGELRLFLGQDANIEVQLLISMTTKAKDILEIFKRFELTKVHRLIFTKLDEVTTFGNMLSAAYWSKRPVSYITTGQNVPEDIELADPLKLARLVLMKDANPFVKKLESSKKQ